MTALSMKTCRKCGTLFSDVRCKVCWKVYNTSRRAKNIEAQKAYAAAYYRKHADRINARINARRAANPNAAKATLAAYYVAHKAVKDARHKKSRQEDPARHKAYTAKWVAAHPGCLRTYAHNRRNREKAGGNLSSGLVARLLSLQRGRCACCGTPLGDKFHLDHIVPLKLGGRNEDGNMQLLTATCNMQKNAKHPVDFMRARGFLL